MIMLLFVAVIVLYLYEFTLLSNIPKALTICLTVLYLYEFTLLSNEYLKKFKEYEVLYLYEFTLLWYAKHIGIKAVFFYLLLFFYSYFTIIL